MYAKDNLGHHKWVKNKNGSIAIRFVVQGKEYYWYRIGPYSDPTSIALANKICADIELAIKLGQFTGIPGDYVPGYRQAALDSVTPHTGVASLASVRSDVIQHPSAPPEPNLKEVWERYKEATMRSVQLGTLNTHWKPTDKAITALSPDDLLPENAGKLYEAIKRVKPTWKSDKGVIHSVLKYIQFASNLAASDKNKSPDIKHNYWGNVLSQIPVKNQKSLSLVADIKGEGKTLCYEDNNGKKRPKCFTQDEVSAIINALTNNTYKSPKSAFLFSHYVNYVTFLVMTGMRPGEALALTWGDIKVSKGRKIIAVQKAWADGYLKEPKTGETRLFPINEQLDQFLSGMARYPLAIKTKFWFNAVDYQEIELVNPLFYGQKLTSILDHDNFNRRIWTPTIKGLVKDGLVTEYLPPYHLRHTFITNLCRVENISLDTVAGLVGNSADVIRDHYYASDNSIVDIPSFSFLDRDK